MRERDEVLEPEDRGGEEDMVMFETDGVLTEEHESVCELLKLFREQVAVLNTHAQITAEQTATLKRLGLKVEDEQ